MSILHAFFNQQITYWAPGSPDGFGGFLYAEPVILKAKWEDRTELITDAFNNEYVSRSRVFVDRDMQVDGYLYLGVSHAVDPRTVNGAHRIRDFRKIPDLNAADYERRVFL